MVSGCGCEEDGGSGGPTGDGTLEWVCSNVRDEIDLELVYEISAPLDLQWERYSSRSI